MHTTRIHRIDAPLPCELWMSFSLWLFRYIFYPAGLISVEEIGRLALEAVRDKWERKGGPNFQNAGMGESREGHSKHAKSFSWGALELSCKLLASFYCGHVSHVSAPLLVPHAAVTASQEFFFQMLLYTRIATSKNTTCAFYF